MDEFVVKLKYKELKFRLIVTTIIFIILMLPKLVMWFSGMESIWVITYEAALIPQLIAIVFYCYFVGVKYKCPKCTKYPGSGWTLKNCKSCGVSLS